LTSQESYQAYKESGDKRFKKSATSLIIEKKDNITNGFLMTVIPDKNYLLSKKFDGLSSHYRNWQNNFSGMILYHKLDGSFSNGWKFSEGLVVSSVKCKELSDLPIELTKSCLAWYYVVWIEICDGNNSTKGCYEYETWYYLYTTCDEGGGGDGGYQSNTPNVDLIYNASSTLSSSQKQKLETAIVEFKTKSPIFATIWQSLINNGLSLKFIINPYTPVIDPITGVRAPAAISADGTLIEFREEECIISDNLEEELIHKYQRNFYGSQFVDTKRNFEFETKVIRDYCFAKEYGYCRAVAAYNFQSQEVIDSYVIWILDLVLS